MKKLIPLVALTLASMASIAQEDLIAKLDSNNDGLISIQEAANNASLSAMFAEIDINKDGFLSASELENQAH